MVSVWLILLLASLYLADGHLFYSLDDPYIHLRVAERIAAGEYGMNPGEFATPVSSILWPYLLVPFASASWGHFIPLVINTLCLLGTAILLCRCLQHLTERYAAVIAFCLLFFLNGICIVFTGMEHSLQLLLAVAITTAMLELTADHPLPRWLGITLIVAPLIRYELITFSVGAIVLLALYKRYRYLWALVPITFVMGLFSFYLWQHSGYPLPASIYSKMDGKSREIHNFLTGACEFILLLLVMLRLRHNRNVFFFCGWIASALLAHLLFGAFGWLSRYEIYVIIPAALTLIYYLPQSGLIRGKEIIAFAAVLMLFVIKYPITTVSVPAASAAIYGMHGQLQRLLDVAGYPRLGTNDIGYVSLHNPSYVLDVWGLSSADVWKQRSKDGAGWLARIGSDQVELIMIFPSCFPDTSIPSGWVKLGMLELVRYPGFIRVIGDTRMDIYATSRKNAVKYIPAVTQWEKDLPKSVRWIYTP